MEPNDKTDGADTDRRAFLTTAGKFAVVTPPMMTMLLSTTLASPAIAASGASSGPIKPGKPPKKPKPPKPKKH